MKKGVRKGRFFIFSRTKRVIKNWLKKKNLIILLEIFSRLPTIKNLIHHNFFYSAYPLRVLIISYSISLLNFRYFNFFCSLFSSIYIVGKFIFICATFIYSKAIITISYNYNILRPLINWKYYFNFLPTSFLYII